jgi:hypothetical protein
MRAVKLKVIKPDDPPPLLSRIPWRPALRRTWLILSWSLWILWQITKMTVVVVGIMIGVWLIIVGFLSHFVGGPPRWQN